MNESPRRRSKYAPKTLSLPLACGYALLVGVLSAIVLLLLATAITYAQADPIRFSTPAALAALYLAIAFTGIVSAHTSQTPLVAGILCGTAWLVLILLLSLIAGGSDGCGFGTLGGIIAHAGIPIAAVLGSLIGKKRTKRPSSHRKKRRR